MATITIRLQLTEDLKSFTCKTDWQTGKPHKTPEALCTAACRCFPSTWTEAWRSPQISHWPLQGCKKLSCLRLFCVQTAEIPIQCREECRNLKEGISVDTYILLQPSHNKYLKMCLTCEGRCVTWSCVESCWPEKKSSSSGSQFKPLCCAAINEHLRFITWEPEAQEIHTYSYRVPETTCQQSMSIFYFTHMLISIDYCSVNSLEMVTDD